MLDLAHRAQIQSASIVLPASPIIQSQPFVYVGIYGADNKTAPTAIVMGSIGYAVNGERGSAERV